MSKHWVLIFAGELRMHARNLLLMALWLFENMFLLTKFSIMNIFVVKQSDLSEFWTVRSHSKLWKYMSEAKLAQIILLNGCDCGFFKMHSNH